MRRRLNLCRGERDKLDARSTSRVRCRLSRLRRSAVDRSRESRSLSLPNRKPKSDSASPDIHAPAHLQRTTRSQRVPKEMNFLPGKMCRFCWPHKGGAAG